MVQIRIRLRQHYNPAILYIDFSKNPTCFNRLSEKSTVLSKNIGDQPFVDKY